MTSLLQRYSSICHFLLGSMPLLIILSVLYINFGNEAEVLAWFTAHAAANPDLKSIAKIITDWGNAAFYPIYLWFLISGIRQRKKSKSRLRFALVFLAVQLIVSLITVRFLKIAIGKPRPGEGTFFEPFSTKGVHHSMPSGHTCEVYGAALPLILRYKHFLLTLTLGLFAAAVAFSRIYLSWHHPSDVLCGWMLGSVAGFAIHLFSKED
ncbi:phosphatase PAP2 family protein [Maridesulfovibrio hydrothermalis]|uniref:Phosphoesterase PA-phosphatase related n=1 Tax=Maridesulfovibrio hydrothermalis AM13 = DSM 14728 TaxID=1121451 RepID=L0R7G9_9BACT|nr:phosphatase PAP2 family protein [Maridesulfovibrio hydrothermalis]CCO22135.1 Phosphoesterase PA-phosphatase related [Maridesulfovibrio hydrothermalis AM13 = DSM 14728]